MNILPAIDLLDNTAVRLLRGDYNTKTRVASDPIECARAFASDGAQELHLVDLSGAKMGKPVHSALIREICHAVNIPCEVGGGIRTMEDLELTLKTGAKRAILGSSALKDPAFVKKALLRYPAAIAIGIDARDGMVSTEGWLTVSTVDYLSFAREMLDFGAQTIIFTDIARDGTLTGPNLSMLEALRALGDYRLIASGGIRDTRDIRALEQIPVDGAICGKSLYAGTLTVKDALLAAGGPTC